MRHLILAYFLVSSISSCWSQIPLSYQGARSTALGQASASIADEYSLFNNIAGISRLEKSTAIAGYQNRYSIASFRTVAAGFVLPRPNVNLALAFLRFGDNLFSQQRIRAGIGNSIQFVRLGLALDYEQYSIESIGVSRAFSVSFGGIAEITSSLHFAFHISNVTRAKLNTSPAIPLPTLFYASMSLMPSEELLAIVEVEKDLGFREILKCGLEYQLLPAVAVRTGVQPAEQITSFGVGFRSRKLNADYAFSPDPRIGHSHDLSFFYQIK